MGILIAVLVAGAIQAGAQDSPETLVRSALGKVARDKAVLQTLTCDKTEATEQLDGNGKPKGPVAVEKEKSYITMSLIKLLKEGRYQYRFEGLAMTGDRMAIKLGYSPAPSENQPKPEQKIGEGMIAQGVEDGLNKVLNSLEGNLYLDQETLGIVRFEAHLPKEVFHVIAWISITDITYDQVYAFGIWVPRKVVVDTRVAKFIKRPRQYRRTTRSFTNYRPKVP